MKKFTLVFISLQIYSLSINAQWSSDPQVADTKVCTESSAQRASYIIADGSGGAIVFWQDERNISGGSYNTDIYYNKLNSAGNAVWSSTSAGLALTNYTNNETYIDQVISDGSGGAFISWETYDESDQGNVFVQHINSSGAKTWLATGIPISTTAFNGFICSDNNGGIIIAWSDNRDDLTDGRPNAYAQRISSAGNKLWAADGILLENATGFSGPIGIIPDGSGGAIIAMGDSRNGNYLPEEETFDNIDIYAQRINAAGNAVWAATGVPVCTQTNNQDSYADGQHPYIVSDGAGGAIICWEDYRNDANNGIAEPHNEDVFCQRINASGVAQWTANGVLICNASNPQTEISLIPDGAGGAVLIWIDERSGFHLYTQKINGSGAVQWAANGLLVATASSYFDYTASLDATSSSVLITWVDSYDPPQDIMAQKISTADGSLLWGSGVLVCGRADAQTEPAITHDGGGGAIISWTDERNSATSGNDIYANRVLANGTLPLMLVTFEAQLINKDVLLQWSTSSEQNTSHFNIERSMDGNNFTAIGKVNAAGNSSSTIKYSFPDNTPVTGNNFYRLKMVDRDGHFSYSKTVAIKVEGNSALKIFPVPAKNTLNIFTSGASEKATIQIVDLSGKTVQEQNVILTGNTSIDISNLPKSIYTILIKRSTTTEQQKFVKE